MSLPRISEVTGLKRSPWAKLKAGLKERFGWLWKPVLFAGILGGFLMGRAAPGVHLAPLGVAFYAAVRGAGFSAFRSLPVLVAVLLGAVTVLPAVQIVWIAAALGLCHCGALVLGMGKRSPAPIAAAVLAAVSALLPGLMAGPLMLTESMLFWVGITGVLGLVFTLGIHDITTRRRLLNVSPDSPVPAIILIASVLSGLEGVTLFHQAPLRDIAAGLMVMMCAYAGGPPMGAAAGAVLGFSFLFDGFGGRGSAVLSGVLPESRAMAYVAAGVLSGTFRELGRLGVGVAFCLGWVAIAFSMASISNTSILLSLAYSAVAATVIYWVVPYRWVVNLPSALVMTGSVDRQSPPEPVTDATTFLVRTRSLAHALKELGRAYEQVAAVDSPSTEDEARLFEQVTERVCHSCALFDQCWQKEPAKTYRLFNELWGQINESGPIKMHPVPEELERHCVYPAQVAFTLNYLHDLQRSQRHWERRLGDGRMAVGEYVRNASLMLEHFAEEMADPAARRRTGGSPLLQLVTGVVRLPKRGGFISGDSYVDCHIDTDRYLLALSDGMGVGQRAAEESKRCVHLLQEVLEAGFNPEVAVKTVNSALLLRSSLESFVTVDMLLADLSSGKAEFVKVGAAPSFIKRGSDVTVVKTASVPAGIVDQVQVEPEYRTLLPGDLIVMITDGIWDVSKDESDKERWIIQYLGREVSSDPAEIAEALLAKALERMPDVGDDMTVLVARVDTLSSYRTSERARRSISNGWVPAKVVNYGKDGRSAGSHAEEDN